MSNEQDKIQKLVEYFASLGITAQGVENNPKMLELVNLSETNKTGFETGKANEFFRRRDWLGLPPKNWAVDTAKRWHWDEYIVDGGFCSTVNGKYFVDTTKCCNEYKTHGDPDLADANMVEYTDRLPMGFAFQYADKGLTANKKYLSLKENAEKICSTDRLLTMKKQILKIYSALFDKETGKGFETPQDVLDALFSSEQITAKNGWILDKASDKSTDVMKAVFDVFNLDKVPQKNIVSNDNFYNDYNSPVILRGFAGNSGKTQNERTNETRTKVKSLMNTPISYSPTTGAVGAGDYFAPAGDPVTALKFGGVDSAEMRQQDISKVNNLENLMVARLSPDANVIKAKDLDCLAPFVFRQLMNTAEKDEERRRISVVCEVLQNGKFPSRKHRYNFPMKSAIALLCGYDAMSNEIKGTSRPESRTESEFIIIKKSALVVPEKAVLTDKENDKAMKVLDNSLDVIRPGKNRLGDDPRK